MTKRLRLFFALALATLAADQVTKYLAVSRLTSALDEREGLGARLGGFFTLHNLDNEPPTPEGINHARGRAVRVLDDYWHHRYVENPGAAFGAMGSLPEHIRRPFFHLVGVLALGFIFWMFLRLEPHQRLLQVALSLLSGGALGNFLDRLLHGYVIDFIDWHWRNQPGLRWPTFNLADSAICVGLSFLLLDALKVRREQPVAAPSGAPPVLPGL
jgi:signal peptidase II